MPQSKLPSLSFTSLLPSSSVPCLVTLGEHTSLAQYTPGVWHYYHPDPDPDHVADWWDLHGEQQMYQANTRQTRSWLTNTAQYCSRYELMTVVSWKRCHACSGKSLSDAFKKFAVTDDAERSRNVRWHDVIIGLWQSPVGWKKGGVTGVIFWAENLQYFWNEAR